MPPPFFSTSVGTSTSLVVTRSVGAPLCVLLGIGFGGSGGGSCCAPANPAVNNIVTNASAAMREKPRYMPDSTPDSRRRLNRLSSSKTLASPAPFLIFDLDGARGESHGPDHTRLRASRSIRPVHARKLSNSQREFHMNPNTSRALSVSAGLPE